MNNNIEEQPMLEQKQVSTNGQGNIILNRVKLVVVIINFILCLISICYIAVTSFSGIFEGCETSNACSGWFLFVDLCLIGLYALSFIPDLMCLVFSFFKKRVFYILTIIASVVGCLVIDINNITSLLFAKDALIIERIIYTIFKIIIILLNIIAISKDKKING